MNIFVRLDEVRRTEELEFLIIGGRAVNAHGYSRWTQDLDLLIPREKTPQWRALLENAGYVVEHDTGNFIHLSPPRESSSVPIDLILVSTTTFAQMNGTAGEIQIDGRGFKIPSLDHLLALKLHAIKFGAARRGYKDFMDILSLIDVNGVDVLSDKFRLMCERYGDRALYERIIGFKQM